MTPQRRPAPPVQPRPAATTILLRDVDGGPPELLLLRRHDRSGFVPNVWVFPGGAVDEADRRLDPACWTGIEPAALVDRFGLPADLVLGMHVAAVREAFEEAGVLLATTTDGAPVDHRAPAVQRARHALMARRPTLDLATFLREEGLVLDLGRLTYHRRWITPPSEPRRFDTCFFLAPAPADVTARHDAVETVDLRWASARDALADDTLTVIYPTRRTLEGLVDFTTADQIIAAARAAPAVVPVQPHVITDADGRPVRIVSPGEPGYPTDPEHEEA